MNGEKLPLISVVVPVKNGAQTIEKCVDSILAQRDANYELIVVDDGSNDSTADKVARFKDVRLLRTAGLGAGAAKNEGLKAASGEYVAFTDSDCLVDPDWLAELRKGVGGEGIAACGGSQDSPQDESAFGRDVHSFFRALGFVSEYYKEGQQIVGCDHNPTCNALFVTAALREIGGFSDKLWPCEDLELDYRLLKKGYRLNFNPAAKVYHYRPQSFAGLLRMMLRYGSGHADLIKMCGFHRRIHLLPFLSLAAVILLFVGGWQWGGAILLKLLLGIFILSMLYFSWKTRQPQKSARFSAWLVLSVLSWNLGFWPRLVRGK
jgi:glycosyltransferase involved in cell wall biosynthesis